MPTTLKQLTHAQAESLFPGCITEDIKESAACNTAANPHYHRLSLWNDRLVSSCYEVAYFSWMQWNPEESTWEDCDGPQGIIAWK